MSELELLSTGELTTRLRDARGEDRREIIAELQRRYDATVPLVQLSYHPSYGACYSRRYEFALYHA
jgi:hypothetical protein